MGLDIRIIKTQKDEETIIASFRKLYFVYDFFESKLVDNKVRLTIEDAETLMRMCDKALNSEDEFVEVTGVSKMCVRLWSAQVLELSGLMYKLQKSLKRNKFYVYMDY